MKYWIVKFKTWFIWIMIFISILLSPFIGKGVENTTKALISGLSTEKQIETMATVVDENKLEAENKVKELESTIEIQKSEPKKQQENIETQKKIIEQQKESVENTKVEVVKTKESVTKSKDCSKDVAKYCYTSSFKDPDEFKSFLKVYEKESNYSEYKEKFTKEFNLCQKALNCQ